jgi:hypothetical protein
MPKLKELIGSVVTTAEHTLHTDFIDRFAKATLQSDKARLSYSALASLGDFEAVFKKLNVHPKHLLHVRESLTITKEPVLEKPLSVETKIKDLYEQQAGDKPMGFLVISVSGQQSGKPSFLCERIYAASGGFPRG